MASPLPLAGLKVLDFTTLLPGPLATLMLAEAGADVLKIERPGGEDMRRYQPAFEEQGAAFSLLNRGKRSQAIDLKSESGLLKVKSLLEEADILVEQFRPGVMERLGLGYEAVSRAFSRLIYCSISGYGQSGPRAAEAGHDINYIAATGLLALQPGPLERPVVPPALVADIGGGTFPAVINILLALRQRDLTGRGCRLDIAMTDAMFMFAWHALASGHAGGAFPKPGASKLVGGSPRYQLYRTRDDKLVACGALEDHFWRAFTAAIGLDAALADDARDPARTREAVAARIAQRTAAEWKPVLAAADCCATIVASLEEALRDPHFVQRGLFDATITAPSGATLPALPLPLDPQFRAPAGSRPDCRLDGER
ncbi:MAG: CoA transferase [Pseudorhodoplanes sp.]|nr:CoA transferase [Pseudorhodoplanes sp.]